MESPEDGAGARGIIDHNGKLTRHEQAQLLKCQCSEYVVFSHLRPGFRAIPANNEVIQDFADSFEFPDGSTNIHVITVYVDDSLQADAIRNATNDQRSNVEPIFSQQGLTDIRRQLM